MATVYSDYSAGWKPKGSDIYKKYRARLDYSVSAETDTTITYAAVLYVNINSSVTADYSGTLNMAGTSYSGSCSTVFGEGNTVTCVSKHTKTFNKGTAPTTVRLSGGVRSSNGSWTGATVTAYKNVTIPAKRYPVTYDANGGQNPPAVQKKVHDTALLLSAAIPTKASYDFVEWNTAADGTGISYQPGDTLSSDVNQSLTLYAIWHISYQPPQLGNLRAYRVAATGSGRNPAVKSDGTRCYCDFEYTPSVDSDAVTNSITIQFGNSAPVNASVYNNLRFGYSAANHLPTTSEETVTITIKVTDYLGNQYTYQTSTYISTENYVFDAFKGTDYQEEYQSFALGGKARDFDSPNRSAKGDFDIYMDPNIVLADCTITDSGTALSITEGADTEDGKLAQAIIDSFGYATAKDILEV